MKLEEALWYSKYTAQQEQVRSLSYVEQALVVLAKAYTNRPLTKLSYSREEYKKEKQG